MNFLNRVGLGLMIVGVFMIVAIPFSVAMGVHIEQRPKSIIFPLLVDFIGFIFLILPFSE